VVAGKTEALMIATRVSLSRHSTSLRKHLFESLSTPPTTQGQILPYSQSHILFTQTYSFPIKPRLIWNLKTYNTPSEPLFQLARVRSVRSQKAFLKNNFIDQRRNRTGTEDYSKTRHLYSRVNTHWETFWVAWSIGRRDARVTGLRMVFEWSTRA
jgi:hypothetical protein